ncbi:ABC transporter permease [Arthrobacter sp. I2-34]|uniref:ABC transporter permease n=1 Tax=Arthrobacter hankyongi TaxID=2904801 RepID=A0ABS9L8D5_9MICC|nr:ABC transporter permease [Arthrobacter hankyongi]MCG2622937.1 ABC transporter permease [Arthrobacter hankyongi]
MLRYSLRSLLAHKLRLVLTVAAVTVGVAFVSASFVLSDTMGKAFDELFAGLAKGTDVVVRAESIDANATARGQVRPLDEDIVDTVRKVSGVAAAEGSVTGFALILDKDGQPIQPGGAPTLGSSTSTDSDLSGNFSLRSGQVPAAPDEMAVDAASAAKAGYKVGDRAAVIFEDGTEEFTITGIVGFGDTDSLAGATLASFETATAQKLLGKAGKFDQIDVRAADGISAVDLRDELAQALPAGTEALTADQVSGESAQAIRDGLGIFTNVLLTFAGVSLLVGSFVIWNTFNVLVAQRRREVALLRAVGAKGGQVLGGIILEAGLIGLVSAGLGLAAGVGLAGGIRSLLAAVGIEVPTTAAVVEPRTIVAALLVGVVITVVAAVVPAVSATRVAPMEALRTATPADGSIGRSRSTVGILLLAASAAALATAALLKDQLVLTGLGALAGFAGLVVAGPLLARAMAGLANRGRAGGGWSLAARNITRAPKRAAATALALTIGLTVVCAVAVVASSTKASVTDLLSGGNRADLILQAASPTGGVSPAVARILDQQAEVDAVLELRFSQATVANKSASIIGLTRDTVDHVMDLGITAGSLADFRNGSLLLSTKQAKQLDAGVGDTVTITFPETGERSYEVAALFERDALVGAGYLLTLDDYAGNVTSRMDAAVMVTAASGVAAGKLQQQVDDALADFPNVQVSDPTEFAKSQQASVDQMLGLVTALLALAVIVAVLGIINTLVLSVVERTRELGLMRAVGATRRQVRTVIRRESVLMSLFGAIAGVLLGTGAGIALARAMNGEGISSLDVPLASLAVYVVVAAVIGVLAAIGPARRASRVDVLRAITVD